MPITYVNRKGVTYTLVQIQTPTGKPRYIFAQQSKGTPADEAPAGFRVSENARGVVSLIKDLPTLIRPEEVAAVEDVVRRLPMAEGFRVVGQHDRIELYATMEAGRFSMFGGGPADGSALPGQEGGVGETGDQPARYEPELRFVLIDPERRVFRADEIISFWRNQEWRWLAQTGEIAELARATVPTLSNRPVGDPFRFEDVFGDVAPLSHASDWPGSGRSVRRDARRPLTQPDSVHQLKVTLTGSRPPIWRRLLVPSDITLDRLHDILQIAMGWEDDHLHQFQIEGMTFSDSRYLDDTGNPDEATVRLDHATPYPKARFRYEYDFGDSWDHELLVEAVAPPEPGTHYPICIAGNRAAPPEDCGGVWSYAHLLEVLGDPKHPDYAEWLEWLGGPFDPEVFGPDAVNQRLAGYV